MTTDRLDATDSAEIARFAQEQTTFDVLANVAGSVHHGSILECTERGLRLFHEPERQVHVPHDPGLAASHARSRGRQHRQRRIGVLELKGLPNRFIYGTSKAAVIGLTKSVAADYVRQGVLQRDRAGHGREPILGRAHRGVRRS